MLNLVLFCNEGTNVRLEATGSNTHDDESNDEACQCLLGMNDDCWNRGYNHDDMTNP